MSSTHSRPDFEPRPPPVLYTAFEMPRTIHEAALLAASWCALRRSPQGDGHPVLVIPGFCGGDESTWLLRTFLTQQGYRALPWLQGTNTGSHEVQEGLVKRVFRIIRRYRRPVSLIGQSLGGVFAREMARRFSDNTRCVITLGSPFGAQDSASTNPAVLKLFEQLSGLTIDELRGFASEADVSEPPPGIPTTAVYSRTDGVVQWETCVEASTPTSESVEVCGSHSGMAVNAEVYRIIANRLAQRPEHWRPYEDANARSPSRDTPQ